MVYTDGPGPLAQWSELAAHTRSVAGSSPAGPTILGGGLPSWEGAYHPGRGPTSMGRSYDGATELALVKFG
jgi:hypothetical protein